MLERRHQGRQERLQPLAAHPVRRLPQNDQPLGHGRVVDAPAPGPRSRRGGTSVEDADRVLAVVPGESHELIQDLSTVIRNRVNLNRWSTTTSWGSGVGHRQTRASLDGVRGAGVKAVSPAKAGAERSDAP